METCIHTAIGELLDRHAGDHAELVGTQADPMPSVDKFDLQRALRLGDERDDAWVGVARAWAEVVVLGRRHCVLLCRAALVAWIEEGVELAFGRRVTI